MWPRLAHVLRCTSPGWTSQPSTWARRLANTRTNLAAGCKQLSKCALKEHAVTATWIYQPPPLTWPVKPAKEVIDDRGRRVDSRRLMQPLYRFCSRLIYLGDVRMWVINRLFGHCEFLWAPGTLHLPLG